MLNPGDTLGRYELLCPLARGGMAEVWAARLHGSRGFQKVVAIKTILSSALSDTRLEQMLLQEAHLVSHIHHPNVAQTLELGEENGTLFIVMEWVHGEPLRALLDRRAPHLPPAAAVNLIGQAARGLHAAHVALDPCGRPLGIVHRDVSPQNLLVTYDGMVKVLDFGVAKALEAPEELTEAGELKGKLAFMSPEQLRGESLDARSDIFSLAEILYWALTGRHPYLAAAAAQTRDNIARARPPAPPSVVQPRIGTRLDVVILSALSAERSDRPSSAQEFYEQLACACPQAFSAIAQAQLVEHLERAFEGRAEQRKQQLVRAQQMLDPMRSDSGMVASLGGMALTRQSVGSGPHRPAESSQRSASPGSAVRTPGVSLWTRRVGLATAASAVIAGVSFWTMSGRQPQPRASAGVVERFADPPASKAEQGPPTAALSARMTTGSEERDLAGPVPNGELDAGTGYRFDQDGGAGELEAESLSDGGGDAGPSEVATVDPSDLPDFQAPIRRARRRAVRRSGRASRRRSARRARGARRRPAAAKAAAQSAKSRPPRTKAPQETSEDREASPAAPTKKEDLDVWDLESFGGRY